MIKKRIFILLIISLIFSFVSVNAADYLIEFDQSSQNIIVRETINNHSNSYSDPESLTKDGNQLYFLKKINFPDNFSSVEIRLNLDQGIIIQNQNIFPENYIIETDGQSISIIWNLENVTKADAFAIFVQLQDTKNSFLVYLLVLLIIIAVIVFLLLFRIKSKKIETSFLLDSEKKVIEELKKAAKNELWQKQIQNATGFSKAKVSRLIRNLEVRNLVRKIPLGNTNKIKLI